MNCLGFLTPLRLLRDLFFRDFLVRDFAKSGGKRRSGASQRSRKKADPVIPPWLWISFGLCAGLFVALLVYLHHQEPLPAARDPKPTTKQPAKPKSKFEAVPPSDTKPETYQFRDMLEKKTITVEVEPPVAKGAVIMQCGAFRQFEAADNLKARLALLGFEASIKESVQQSSTWHRVLIGPYDSRREAENDRHYLQANEIHHCKIWSFK